MLNFDEDSRGLSEEENQNYDSPIALMKLVVKDGKRLYGQESLEAIAKRTAASVASLPAATRQLNNPISPPVEISTDLQNLTNETRQKVSC